jgi:cytochrome P450 family 135
VRRCIGASFAQVEMRTVLREVLRRVRLRAPSRRPERPRVVHVTAVPARGARVIVEERLHASAPGHTGEHVDRGPGPVVHQI